MPDLIIHLQMVMRVILHCYQPFHQCICQIFSVPDLFHLLKIREILCFKQKILAVQMKALLLSLTEEINALMVAVVAV